MGCGCKNKANNQTPATPQTAGSQKQTNQIKILTVRLQSQMYKKSTVVQTSK